MLPLVYLFGRLPDPFSRAFAAVLNAGTRPFHHINYLGSVGGALVFHGPRLTRQLDRIIDRLHCRLDAESDAALARRMHFPVGWDPFFRNREAMAWGTGLSPVAHTSVLFDDGCDYQEEGCQSDQIDVRAKLAFAIYGR